MQRTSWRQNQTKVIWNTAVDAAAKTDLNGYTKESVDAFKKALDEAQKILKDEKCNKRAD